MVYITGDIHGNPERIRKFCNKTELTEKDIVIILGDVGANYHGDSRDDQVKRVLDQLKPTILCIHGNHEMRPRNVPGYRLWEWNGGKVWSQDAYPTLLFARDGEIFTLDGLRYFVIGGAYSVDKYYRLLRGYAWFEDEQPDAKTKAHVLKQAQTKPVDIILSHTCPYKYIPREMFIANVDQSHVDDSTEHWLDKIEATVKYKAWFCGHWHTDKHVDRMHFLYHSFETDEQVRRRIETENRLLAELEKGHRSGEEQGWYTPEEIDAMLDAELRQEGETP